MSSISSTGQLLRTEMNSSDLFNEACVELLRDGFGVRFRAGGNSMHPTIRDGELITIESRRDVSFAKNDILLYRTERGVIAHRLIGIEERNQGVFYIFRGDSAYAPDEPVAEERVLGRVTAVQRRGRTINLNRATNRLIQVMARAAFRSR